MWDLLEHLNRLTRKRGQKAWLVGGFVRDLILGRPGRDVDVAVTGSGAALAGELAAMTGSAFVPMDPAHDVSRVVRKTKAGVEQLDITGLAQVDLLADLRRRDFTVNAMALPLGDYLSNPAPTPGQGATVAGNRQEERLKGHIAGDSGKCNGTACRGKEHFDGGAVSYRVRPRAGTPGTVQQTGPALPPDARLDQDVSPSRQYPTAVPEPSSPGELIGHAAGPVPGGLIDPLGGLVDLRRGLIRACGPRSIADDPLRALRAARFAGQAGWRIEAETVRLIRAASMRAVAPERVLEELVHILSLPDACRVIRMLDGELGILEQLFPEIVPLRRMEQNGHHVDNVWEHSLKTLQCFETVLEESGYNQGAGGTRNFPRYKQSSLDSEIGTVTGTAQGIFQKNSPGTPCLPAASDVTEDGHRTEPGKDPGSGGGYPGGNKRAGSSVCLDPSREGTAGGGVDGVAGKEAHFPPPDPFVLPPQVAGPLAAYINSPLTRARSRLPVLKLACLFHDTGKLTTRAVAADGRFTFYGHHTAGAPAAAAIARRLRLSRREADLLAALVRGHMDPLFLYKSRPVSGRAAYRFFRRLGDEVPGCLLISLADISSSRLAAGAAAEAAAYRDFIAGMLQRYFKEPAASGRSRPLLSGREVCRLLDIEPSPLVGRLLEELAAARAAGEVRTCREAEEWVRKNKSKMLLEDLT
ncbi:HD domain-containing protein [Desulfotomaculum copahuensis]|uniref:HD/PDEase domain-containing protein n=1 Tax=Desulfotomaculum copahuensis TaxID=1838280 RepID=A0A1B7LCK6_9FIRM|nr:HD domain-containing protein [Desulfotomaculum copahuensis]OAT80415.1 hypothetical protein A6M21_00630 [Desulfotomaculum copahuensis]